MNNCKTYDPAFGPNQIKKCKVCRAASANVNHPVKIGWCPIHRTKILDQAKINPSPIIVPEAKLDRSMPSMIQQAKNLTGSMVDYAKSGFKNRTDKEKAKCMAICKACDWSVEKAGTIWCPKCGCCSNLSTRLASKHCPLPEPRW